jgi:hypothetical protein
VFARAGRRDRRYARRARSVSRDIRNRSSPPSCGRIAFVTIRVSEYNPVALDNTSTDPLDESVRIEKNRPTPVQIGPRTGLIRWEDRAGFADDGSRAHRVRIMRTYVEDRITLLLLQFTLYRNWRDSRRLNDRIRELLSESRDTMPNSARGPSTVDFLLTASRWSESGPGRPG